MGKNKTFGNYMAKVCNEEPATNQSLSDIVIADALVEISADKIKPSPFNEGLDMKQVEEYAESMRTHGIMEPIVVYDLKNGEFEILSGHQRFEAWCKILGNKTIKAVVRPYETDPMKRFRAHTEANTKSRNVNIGFWLSRIKCAKQVIKDSGFDGSREEEIKLLSSLLDGMSQPQIYRYEAFERLIPELQEFGIKEWLSSNTLYGAIGLEEEQQREVARIINEIYNNRKNPNLPYHEDFEITREEFNRIVKNVKEDNTEKPSKKISSLSEKITKGTNDIIKIFKKTETWTTEEKSGAIESLDSAIAELNKLKKKIEGN